MAWENVPCWIRDIAGVGFGDGGVADRSSALFAPPQPEAIAEAANTSRALTRTPANVERERSGGALTDRVVANRRSAWLDVRTRRDRDARDGVYPRRGGARETGFIGRSPARTPISTTTMTTRR